MSDRVDPDPWVITSLVIASVGTIAQLVQVGIAWQSRTLPPPRRSLKVVRTHLMEATEDCVRRIDRIVRLLPKLEGVESDPLESRFEFGSSTLLVSRIALHEYQSQIDMLLSELTLLSNMTLALIGDDEAFAAEVGIELAKSFSNINDRINGFYRTSPPIGDVLSECLMIIREFERILVRLEQSN